MKRENVPFSIPPESGMRMLRGNISSRTASRNEEYKEEKVESKDASEITAIKSPRTNSTGLKFN